jgi:hypothetical protein
MPPFPKPSFTYNYQLDAQIQALRDWEKTEPGRNIPAKAQNRVLLATWNICQSWRARSSGPGLRAHR